MANFKLLQTLADCHQFFSDYVGEDSPPSTTDPEYARRTRWFNGGREDQAGTWFFISMLTSTVVTITANSVTPIPLPQDFQSPQSLRTFTTVLGNINYTDPFEPNGNLLTISRNFTTGLYEVTLSPVPIINDTANVFYYSTPAPMVNSTDLVHLDGDLVVKYALMQYHLKNGDWTDYQELKDIYDEELQETVRMDAINIAGSTTDMNGTEIAAHAKDQRLFYQGNTRKNGS